MANYGLTEYGFVVKRFDVILQELRNNLLSEFPDAAIGDNDIIGHLLDIYAKEPAELWELAEIVYKSRAPSSADGQQLDDIGQINAIERGGPRPTFVIESFSGINNTVITTAFLFKRLDQDEEFKPTVDFQLDNTSTSQTLCQVITVLNNYIYTIVINNNSVNYTSDSDATIEEIAAGLVGNVNAQTEFLKVNAIEDDYSQGTFYIRSNNGEDAFTLVLPAELTLNQFWTPAKCRSIDEKDISAPAGTLDQIVTPVAGLNEIINFADGIIGSAGESDQSYRIKLFTEQRRLGGGSLEAIKDRILNEVENVVLVKAFENDTMIVDVQGRPPKSIELLVEGGDENDIAQELWYTKGGGIETFGSETVIITDSQGDLQAVKFSRPTSKYVHFNITLTTTSEFPTNGVETIKENIVILGRANFTIGDLLLIQEFYTPIYVVSGITNAIIEWAVTDNPGDTPTYISTNIQLDQTAAPIFDTNLITVTT